MREGKAGCPEEHRELYARIETEPDFVPSLENASSSAKAVVSRLFTLKSSSILLLGVCLGDVLFYLSGARSVARTTRLSSFPPCCSCLSMLEALHLRTKQPAQPGASIVAPLGTQSYRPASLTPLVRPACVRSQLPPLHATISPYSHLRGTAWSFAIAIPVPNTSIDASSWER